MQASWNLCKIFKFSTTQPKKRKRKQEEFKSGERWRRDLKTLETTGSWRSRKSRNPWNRGTWGFVEPGECRRFGDLGNLWMYKTMSPLSSECCLLFQSFQRSSCTLLTLMYIRTHSRAIRSRLRKTTNSISFFIVDNCMLREGGSRASRQFFFKEKFCLIGFRNQRVLNNISRRPLTTLWHRRKVRTLTRTISSAGQI